MNQQSNYEVFWDKVKIMIANLIEKILRDRGFYNLYDDGKIAAIHGNKADVYINGDTVATPNVPIRQGVTLVVGDEVKILNINFSKRDRIIDFKKIF